MTVIFVCSAPICFVNSSDLVALFRHSLDVFCMRGDKPWPSVQSWEACEQRCRSSKDGNTIASACPGHLYASRTRFYCRRVSFMCVFE